MSRRMLHVLAALLLVALAPARVVALTPGKMPSQYVLDTWQLDKGLPQNSPLSLAQTHDGYLWVGTQEGLARFDGVRFVVFDRRSTPQFGSNLITALLADRHERLWIGTSAGLTLLEHQQFKPIGEQTPLASVSIYDVIEDQHGDVWIGTEQGLFREHEGAVAPVNLGSRRPTGRIRALLEDRSGTLWVATALQGVLRLDNQPSSYALVPDETSASIDASALHEDQDGSIWLGTEQGQLYKHTASGFQRVPLSRNIGGTVRALRRDRDGSLWVGSYGGGLLRLRDGKFTSFGLAEGLPGNLA